MMLTGKQILGAAFAAVVLATANVLASPVDSELVAPVHHVFHSRASPDTKLRFVRNSGVCETTPGVNQISGYIDVGTNMSMVRALRL